MNFWKKLNKPIIGLSPMDGITDSPFRLTIANIGKPDVMYTEFVNVDGILHASTSLFDALLYHEIERPIVAQLFGVNPDLFYKASQIICSLGFDGIDINMGCPARKVSQRGAGASLIGNPQLAKKIILAVKEGVKDYVRSGISYPDKKAIDQLDFFKQKLFDMGVEINEKRSPIPVSVKTRIGVEKNTISSWISEIIESKPDCISVHGRTLKEMYTGEANWKAIDLGGKIVEEYNKEASSGKITYLGNGDIKAPESILEKFRKYSIDGVLVGRGVLGKPWFFKDIQLLKSGKYLLYTPSIQKICETAIEHAQTHVNIKGKKSIVQIRKHLAWYTKGLQGSSALRQKLVRVNSIKETQTVFNNYLDNLALNK